MNKIIPIVLLFGGLTVFSGLIGKAVTTPAAQMTVMSASSTIESKQAATSDVTQTQIAHQTHNNMKKEFDFNNVNGISLNDNVKTVIDKLGQPLSKEKDAFTPEIVVYAYPKMNIGFSDGIVSYVEVLAAAGTVKIDGISIPIKPEGLKNAMGEPDFVAEDGIVFQRNVALVKLFTDMETHEVTSLQYYHHSNI
jgi:hypothetical protein